MTVINDRASDVSSPVDSESVNSAVPVRANISDNGAVDGALGLDGDPGNVKAYYEEWARSYDVDTASTKYLGPITAARVLKEHLGSVHESILDAGCGTGLVGVELQKLGCDCIDGFDVSPAMAKAAEATGTYRYMRGDIDLMLADKEYSGAAYAAVVSVGVFTLGHVPPEGLEVLLALVKPGGLLLVSTREQYYAQTPFQQVADALQDRGVVQLVQQAKNAPYNDDGRAHYWVFRRSE
jgi:SAM-dependent methyltransferase